MTLTGFGKTVWRQLKDGTPPFDPEKDYTFAPESFSTHMVLDSTFTTIGEAQKEQQDKRGIDKVVDQIISGLKQTAIPVKSKKETDWRLS